MMFHTDTFRKDCSLYTAYLARFGARRGILCQFINGLQEGERHPSSKKTYKPWERLTAYRVSQRRIFHLKETT